jgi:hypothetical protein
LVDGAGALSDTSRQVLPSITKGASYADAFLAIRTCPKPYWKASRYGQRIWDVSSAPASRIKSINRRVWPSRSARDALTDLTGALQAPLIRRPPAWAAERARGSGNNEEGEGNKWLVFHLHTC